YGEAETNARDAVLTSEKTTRSDVKPGFLSTAPSLWMDCATVPVYREGMVSSRRRAPAIETTPMRASVKKSPRHDVSGSMNAPRTGAMAGEMTTIDWTIESTDSCFLPS